MEKRKSKRLNVNIELKISNLFNQNNVLIDNVDAPITVTNISKTGIGFESNAVLPTGYYFNAKINLGDSDSSLYTVVQIVRSEKREDSMYYGCAFIGLAPVLDFIFEDYKPNWESDD